MSVHIVLSQTATSQGDLCNSLNCGDREQILTLDLIIAFTLIIIQRQRKEEMLQENVIR